MLLENKNAVVYGAGGNVGSAVARAFAREGARLFLTGRDTARLESVAEGIAKAGGRADVAEVDALDRAAIEAHAARVAGEGGLHVSFNAIWIRGDLQGTPLLKMSVDDFMTPIDVAARSHFLTATAAARHMVEQRSGAILTLSTTAARLSGRDQKLHATGGFGVACGAIETFTRVLAGEVGPHGVRVVCVRSDALPETWAAAPESFDVGRNMIEGTVARPAAATGGGRRYGGVPRIRSRERHHAHGRQRELGLGARLGPLCPAIHDGGRGPHTPHRQHGNSPVKHFVPAMTHRSAWHERPSRWMTIGASDTAHGDALVRLQPPPRGPCPPPPTHGPGCGMRSAG